MATLIYAGELVVNTCWCGIRHAVPRELEEYQARQFRDGALQTGIYCPLGHRYVLSGEGEAAKLREELDRERAKAASALAKLDQEKASHAATKGHLTKERRRAANGVCPCCKRSFTDTGLARHIKTKHPDFVEVAK